MSREKQVIYSSSISDKIWVSEDIEESDKERSPSPQLVRNDKGRALLVVLKLPSLIVPSSQVVRIKNGMKRTLICSFSLRCMCAQKLKWFIVSRKCLTKLVGCQFLHFQLTTTLTCAQVLRQHWLQSTSQWWVGGVMGAWEAHCFITGASNCYFGLQQPRSGGRSEKGFHRT